MIPRLLARQGWTALHPVLAVAMGVVAALLTWPQWQDIARIATRDEEQSHVLLVPFVAAWMVWVRRVRLRNCPPTGGWIGPVVAGCGLLAAWIGYNHALQALWHAGAVLIVVGSVLSVLGKNVLFRFVPGFAVLVFGVPTPNAIRHAISWPLQSATAAITQVILETFGVAAERHGNLLTINNTDVAVAEACNGMRMVLALILVSYAFAFGMPLRHGMRLVVLLASPIAALFCNVVRLIPTVLLYGYASHDTARWFHDISGWLMLPIAFGLLMGVVKLLSWALIPVNRYTLAYQ